MQNKWTTILHNQTGDKCYNISWNGTEEEARIKAQNTIDADIFDLKNWSITKIVNTNTLNEVIMDFNKCYKKTIGCLGFATGFTIAILIFQIVRNLEITPILEPINKQFLSILILAITTWITWTYVKLNHGEPIGFNRIKATNKLEIEPSKILPTQRIFETTDEFFTDAKTRIINSRI